MDRLLAGVLSVLLGASLADAIVGDLLEERRARGRWWWIRAALSVCARAAAGRLTSGAIAAFLRPDRWTSEARQALRGLRRTPWYAVTSIAVMAVSLTLATTVFAVVDGVLFKPLPYPDARLLVEIQAGWSSRPDSFGNVSASPSDVYAWGSVMPDLPLAAFSLGGRAQVDDGEPARSAEVDSRFFDVLGQAPLLGGFRAEDFTRSPAAPTPVLLSYPSWQRRFGADPAVLGRVIPGEDGDPGVRIVGVMPRDFLFPTTSGRFVPEVLTPLARTGREADTRGGGYRAIARLHNPDALKELETRLQTATTEVARRFPNRTTERNPGPFDAIRIESLDRVLRAPSSATFWLVAISAGVLVVLACVSVTGLSVARAQDRQRELTLRRCLGGSTADLVRLFVLEQGTVVTIGCAIGIAAAYPLLAVVVHLLPESLTTLKAPAVDLRVAAFVALGASMCTTFVVFWPLRVTATSRLSRDLSASGRTSTGSRRASRHVLPAMQVAIALLLTITGGLATQSLWRVWQEPPGYRVADTFVLWLSERRDAPWPVIHSLLADLRVMPEVASAAGSDLWLLQRAARGSSFTAPPGALEESTIESFAVTDAFFETTGLRPTAGRVPSAAELRAGTPVAVVSARVARDYWPGKSPLGQTLVRRGQPFEIVGVVPDARYQSLDLDPEGAIYFPMMTLPAPELVSVFLTMRGGSAQGLQAVTALISNRYPMFRIRSAQSVGANLQRSVRLREFRAWFFGAFSLAGLVIAATGVLGLAAMMATRRTREVGVRMALGATPLMVLRSVFRQESYALWAGSAAGATLAWWLVRSLRGQLYETSVHDPLVWIASVAVVLGVCAAGALIPALRASRVDPVKALRAD